LLKPAGDSDQRRPVVVMVAQQGKQSLLDARRELVADLLEKGFAICLADLRGSGETRVGDGRGRSSSATSVSSSLAMLGQTMLGGQVRDLRSVIGHLRSHPQVRPDRIALWGDSLSPFNDQNADVAVPLDAPKLPEQAEPMGASVVLLTALFEKDLAAVYARAGLVSYASMLRSPFLYLPHDAVPPTAGHGSAGDFRQLVDSLEPLPLRLESMVDGLNRRLDSEQLEREFLRDAKGQRRVERNWQPAVNSETSTSPELAEWLQNQLNR
jgi:hypothetical protein